MVPHEKRIAPTFFTRGIAAGAQNLTSQTEAIANGLSLQFSDLYCRTNDSHQLELDRLIHPLKNLSSRDRLLRLVKG
jgi:hypothetical protein